MLNTATNCIT